MRRKIRNLGQKLMGRLHGFALLNDAFTIRNVARPSATLLSFTDLQATTAYGTLKCNNIRNKQDLKPECIVTLAFVVSILAKVI